MNWHTYSINPIDFHWDRLPTVEETAASIGAHNARIRATGDDSDDGHEINRFIADWESAQEAARAAGWEGDFRNPPAVFWLPSDSEFDYGFVIKQDNNGTTFVMSPVELPHLAGISY